MDWSAWTDPALRALDYTAGVGRYAGAGLANIPYAAKTGKSITQPEDLQRVLAGQAPTASEYMQRTGMQGSPWLDMGADIALDPTTYMTGGASKLPILLGAGALKRGYKVDAVGKLGQVVGSKVFKEKPSFSQLNRWLNSQAKKYGAHPGLVKHYDEAGEAIEVESKQVLPYDKPGKTTYEKLSAKEADAALAEARNAARAEGRDLSWPEILKYKNDGQLSRLEKELKTSMQSTDPLSRAGIPLDAQKYSEVVAEKQARKAAKK